MGKPTVFEISYDQPDGVYYSGSKVSGYVKLAFDEPTRVRAISIRFKGQADVMWKVGKQYYKGIEPYFEQTLMLLGVAPSQNQTEQELPSGPHSFRFEYQLPHGLSSSFQETGGKVKYSATCYLIWSGSLNKKLKVPFTVVGFLDLNTIPTTPLQGTSEKQLCCCCCRSGPIKATLNIEKNTFVPGEAIKIFAQINNGSSRRIVESNAALNLVFTLKVYDDKRIDSREIARVRRPGIAPHGSDVWSGEELVIPPTPPSFLPGCNIIDVKYILRLHVVPAGPTLGVRVPLEIIIGTIPRVITTQPIGPSDVHWPVVPETY
ncbi:arrestin domain-containing protein 3-like [Physella acuta]|uniref:arrestin domain-containing protein 3-like n=1 Tax=Physella acuta TaxID=109671 RepID=UPI0027DBE660|nr:arrestin domain-containing protein 3-like [Physella acuta]